MAGINQKDVADIIAKIKKLLINTPKKSDIDLALDKLLDVQIDLFGLSDSWNNWVMQITGEMLAIVLDFEAKASLQAQSKTHTFFTHQICMPGKKLSLDEEYFQSETASNAFF